MRYLFRGVIRDTGRQVDGHVEAPNEEAAYAALSENAIVAESLRPDPKPLNLSPVSPTNPNVANAIDSALDTASMQVPFDELTDRYKGKTVWVIDRDKIRSRVAQVVDQALAMSLQEAESGTETRQRVAMAIKELFGDNRNIASETPKSAVALEQQVARLGSAVKQIESLLAAMSVALRNATSGGGVPRRMMFEAPVRDTPKYEVLLEIFQDNVELLRTMEGVPLLAESADEAASGQPQPAAESAPAETAETRPKAD